MSQYTRIALLPRDGFFCKDGRGWHTSASGRGHGLEWPWPSTLLGALRTAWGRREETVCGRALRPDEWRSLTADIKLRHTFALRRSLGAAWAQAHRIWPVPLDALWLEGIPHVQRLDPEPPQTPTLGRDEDESREALWRPILSESFKPRPRPIWWPDTCFTAWLCEENLDVVEPIRPSRRTQTHVGLMPEELTADEGVLFSHDVFETMERQAEWAIAAEVTCSPSSLSKLVTLGSDSRLARLEELPHQLFEPPRVLRQAFAQGSPGLRLIVVTPTSFAQGWLPDGFAAHGNEYRGRLPGFDCELLLRAAFVTRPVHISGWDIVAGAPKPSSRMVSAGAVYFFHRTDGRPFKEQDCDSFWLRSLGSRTEEGFGRVVPAIWTSTGGKP